MKRTLAAFAGVLVFAACAAVEKKRSGDVFSPNDLPGIKSVEFQVPSVQTWSLPNGLTVLFREDREVPLVSGALYIPGGSLNDPIGAVGIAAATGSQLREGGVPGFSPDELDAYLDKLAATIESSFGEEFGTVTFSCLSEDLTKVLPIFSDVVQRPAFDQRRLELWRTIALEGIKRRKDDPVTMAAMTLKTVIYGPESAFAQAPTSQSVAKISKADLAAFHKRFIKPSRAIFALSGAVPRDELERLLDRTFGSWKGEAEKPTLPAVTYRAEPGVYLLAREFEQATIMLGHLGPPRHTPDIHAMTVFNRIFGTGGFESLLFSEIRSKRGLAYAIDGGLAPGPVAGEFSIGLGTRVKEAPAAIAGTKEIIGSVLQEAPDNARVEEAKLSIERGFVFRFAESSGIVNRAASLKILGYPEDFDRRYLPGIRAVKAEDVLDTARRWVRPENLAVVVVGKIELNELRRKLPAAPAEFSVIFDELPHISAR